LFLFCDPPPAEQVCTDGDAPRRFARRVNEERTQIDTIPARVFALPIKPPGRRFELSWRSRASVALVYFEAAAADSLDPWSLARPRYSSSASWTKQRTSARRAEVLHKKQLHHAVPRPKRSGTPPRRPRRGRRPRRPAIERRAQRRRRGRRRPPPLGPRVEGPPELLAPVVPLQQPRRRRHSAPRDQGRRAAARENARRHGHQALVAGGQLRRDARQVRVAARRVCARPRLGGRPEARVRALDRLARDGRRGALVRRWEEQRVPRLMRGEVEGGASGVVGRHGHVGGRGVGQAPAREKEL